MRVLDLADSKPRPTPSVPSPSSASVSRSAQLTLAAGRPSSTPNSPTAAGSPNAGAARSATSRPPPTAALATGGTIVKIPEGLDSLSFYGAGMVKKKHKFRKREALNSESSDEGTQADGVVSGQTCLHVNKSVNLNASKKALRQIGVSGDCTTCLNIARKTTNPRRKGKSGDDDGGGEDDIVNGDDDRGDDEDVDDNTVDGDTLDDALDGESSSGPLDVTQQNGNASPTTTTTKDCAIWLCLQCGHQGCGDINNGHVLDHYKVPRSASHALVVNTSSWVVHCFECNDEIRPEPGKALAEAVNFIRKSTGLGKLHKGVKKPSGEKTEVENPRAALMSATSRTAFAGKVMIIKGLNNLGNTCFFNSVVQNVSQTPLVETILAESIKKGRKVYLPGYNPEDEIGCDAADDGRRRLSTSGSEEFLGPLPGLDLVLQDGGQLTNAMVNFLAEMSAPSAKMSVISPGNLFSQICKKTPRFKGFQQQDAHELLRHLLDAMRAEEVKRMKAAILKCFGLPENVNPKNVDEKTKAKLKAYGRQANHTVIDGIFGGQLISTITCSQCQSVNQVFEGFLDLSLPIIEEKGVPPLLRGGAGDDKASENFLDVDSHSQSKRPVSKHMEKKKKKAAKREAKKFAAGRKSSSAGAKETESAGTNGLPPAPEAEALAPYDELADELQRVTVSEQKEREAASLMDSEAAFKNIWIPRRKSDVNDFPDQNGEAESPTSAEAAAAAEEEEEMEQFRQLERQDDSAESEDAFAAALKSVSEIPLETSPDEWILEDAKSGAGAEAAAAQIPAAVSAVPIIDDNSSPHTPEASIFASRASTAEAAVEDVGPTEAADDDTPASNAAMGGDTNALKDVDENTRTTECNISDHPPPTRGQVTEESCMSETEIEPPSDADVEDNAETDNRLLFPAETMDTSVTATETETQGEGSKLDGKAIFVTDENGDPASIFNPTNGTLAHSAASSEADYQGRKKSAGTAQLGLKYCPQPQECSILSSLNTFTAAELLTGSNKFGCDTCTERVHGPREEEKADGNEENDEEEEERPKLPPPKTVYCNASKQLLVHTPPAVLTLHLKRFQQCGSSLRKINKHVEFPLLLDLAPFCSSSCQTIQPGQDKVLYSLYGVVEHSGRMSGGHYVAFVKVRSLSRRCGVFLNYEFNTSLVASENDLSPSSPSSVGAANHMRRLSSTLKGAVPQPPKVAPTDPVSGTWFYVSDTHVVEVTEAKVLKAQAYLLFYERVY